MPNLKQSLHKMMHLCSAALLVAGTFGGVINQPAQKVSAATQTGVGTVNPGDTWDTGNHTYKAGDVQTTDNYTTGSTDGHTVKAGNWFNLVNNTEKTVGYAVFNGALATSYANNVAAGAAGFTVTAQQKINVNLLNNGTTDIFASGDALGFLLTPASTSKMAENAKIATGSSLGINGLPNSFFLGRDLYSNLINGIDGSYLASGWIDGPGNEIAIRSTAASGLLNSANYPNGASNNQANGQAWAQAPTNTNLTGNTVDSETISITWVPDKTNTAPSGFNSGILGYKLTTPDTAVIGDNSKTTELTTKANLADSISLGFLGGTGGHWGNL